MSKKNIEVLLQLLQQLEQEVETEVSTSSGETEVSPSHPKGWEFVD